MTAPEYIALPGRNYNPCVKITFHLEQGPDMIWTLDKPWQQPDMMTCIGLLGAKYGLGLNLGFLLAEQDASDTA